MSSISSGQLYIVATPIGNLSDFSFRAIETLQSVDIIAAEDTRHSKHLLQHYAIATPMQSLHEHNEQQRSEMLLERLRQGESVALISDAGTPLISDPGYRLVSLVKSAGIRVTPVPGSCALIAAMSASGLSSERFSFEGFLPAKASARKQLLQSLLTENRTMIFYESPRRLMACVQDMLDVFGADREICLARELTKLHETIETKTLAEMVSWIDADENQQRGECVLLLQGATAEADIDEQRVVETLTILLKELPVKKAAALTSELTGIAKNQAYQLALKIQQK